MSIDFIIRTLTITSHSPNYMSETLEFSCPSCHTDLRVPLQMAGITGPCPHCQTSITSPSPPPPAPQPAPQQTPQQIPNRSQSKPQSSDYDQKRHRKERSVWPSVMLPTLFLALSAAALYFILDVTGIVGPNDKDSDPTGTIPPTVIEQTTPPTTDPIVPKKPVGETPKPSPPIVVIPTPEPPEPPVEPVEKPKPTPEPPEPEPLEPPQPAEIPEPAITPEDSSKPGEIPTDLPGVVSPPVDTTIAENEISKLLASRP